MNHRLSILLSALLLSTSTVTAQQMPSLESVNSAVQEFMQAPEAVGLSIGILDQDIASTYHFGTVEKGKAIKPSEMTRYELGSNTKTFASTILAQAVLEHKVKLTDDIRKFLPEKYPNLEFEGKPIQLLHLANLTSGLPNWMPDKPEMFRSIKPDSIPAALIKLYRDYSRKDFYRDLHAITLKAQPGLHPAHSNVAAQLLAFILESIYKKPFAELLSEKITGPLNMVHTRFHPIDSQDLAKGYNGNGSEMPYIHLPIFVLAGGLTSNTLDMIKYMRFQLKATNEEAALTHKVTVTGHEDTIGLNWHVNAAETTNPAIWHTGGTFGFSSYLLLLPNENKGIFLMANESDPNTQKRLIKIANKIMNQ